MFIHNGTFIGSSNDSDGEVQFVNDCDLQQDIARGAFADMILDVDRNERYQFALRTVIEKRKSNGEFTHVVDIGTGSGLLSLAAAAAGADHVTALEMFRPSADAAAQTFARSEFADRIRLVAGRSNEIGDGAGLAEKGNIIVAEVFDSELIGEGALRTFKEAHGTLVETVERIWRSVKFHNQKQSGTARDFMESYLAEYMWRTRLDGRDPFTVILKDIAEFCFNFEDADSIRYEERRVVDFLVDPAGCPLAESNWQLPAVDADTPLQLDCLLMWWTLDMDGSGGANTLTMAPTWMDAGSAWRDHWMQVAYFPPGAPHRVRLGETLPIVCDHDEFEFRFALGRGDWSKLFDAPARFNGCAFHDVTSRTALYRMNEMVGIRAGLIFLLKEFCAGCHVIGVGDVTQLALYAALFGYARSVDVIGVDRRCRQMYVDAAARLSVPVRFLDSVEELVVPEAEDNSEKIAIVGEPYFSSSVLPWDDINKYRQVCHEIRQRLGVSRPIKLFFEGMELYVMAVKFDNLWKICASVETALGFDLSHYNKIYQEAIRAADDPFEMLSLWEYPSVVTGQPLCLCSFQFDSANPFSWSCMECGEERVWHDRSGCISGLDSMVYDRDETNAFVFWTQMICYHDEDTPLYVSGANFDTDEPMVGQRPEWLRGYRQGIYFLSRAGDGTTVNLRALSKQLIDYFHLSTS